MREEEPGLAHVRLMIVLIVVVALFITILSYIKNLPDDSKWEEGKAVACSIRAAADSFRREKGTHFDYSDVNISDLGFVINPGHPGGDLDGKYFSDDCFGIRFSANGNYLITIDATKTTTGDPPGYPKTITLDNAGKFASRI
jgi:hypothetical protein